MKLEKRSLMEDELKKLDVFQSTEPEPSFLEELRNEQVLQSKVTTGYFGNLVVEIEYL